MVGGLLSNGRLDIMSNEIKNRDAYDDLHALCYPTPKADSASFTINYGRYVAFEYSTYEPEEKEYEGHARIKVKVFDDGELTCQWDGNVVSILLFASGKKVWKHKYPNGDTCKATFKLIGNSYVELTMKEKSDYSFSKYHPYYSTHKTVLLKSEWDKLVEVAKLVGEAAKQFRESRVSKS
jgi:hypothetical protein